MKFSLRITLTLLLLILFHVAAKAVTSSFTADYASGCAPLVVHFTNTSTGASSYFWDLGNGTTSTLKDVSGTYLTAGTYTVKLVATSGGTSITYTMTITVYPVPTVSFFASDTVVCPNVPITFTSTTAGGTPGAMTYIWNFGDGTNSTAATPTHSYSTPGYYRVTLAVTNSMGCVSTLSKASYIHVVSGPSAKFNVATSVFCNPPASASFTDMSTGTPTLSYLWYFGDGGTSTSSSPTHSYTSNGSYNIKLVVTDGNGCVDSITKPAGVKVGHIKAGFTAVATGCAKSSISFTNTSSPSPKSTSWNFGDGGTSSSTSPAHSYLFAGVYTVTMIVFDGTCYDTMKQTITINPLPTVSFVQSTSQPCPPPTSIKFTGSTSPGSTITWKFGDGGTGSGSPVTHTYTSPGVVTVTMVARDPVTGCMDSVSLSDTFYDMSFKIIDTPNYGCAPLSVHFSISATTTQPDPGKPPHPYPYSFVSYTWNFGDGSPTSSTSAPVHTYTAPGIYRAYVTATTSNGCTFSDTVTIHVGVPPVITATATPSHICYGKSVHIPITVLPGPADTYTWIISGVGAVTNTSGVLDTKLPDPGIYTVTVVAAYNGCVGAPYVIPIPIIVDSPKARMAFTASCTPRGSVSFADSSMGDDSRVWLFGDGTTSTLANPTHIYSPLKKYVVTLCTYNSRSGCRDTTSQPLDLTPTAFDFVADRTVLCRDDSVKLTPIIKAGTIVTIDWRIPGVPITSVADSVTHVLKQAMPSTGVFTVTMVIQDQLGCIDSVTKVNYLTVAKPKANFTVTPTSGCAPMLTTFTDASTDAPGISFVSYDWNFGDGKTASSTTPVTTHTYASGGAFTVKEIVTDNIGCKDTAYYSPITVYSITPSFNASKLTLCPYENTFFTNTTTGASSSRWYFGDGTTATFLSGSHAYAAAGTYTVKLVTTDYHGCTDSVTTVNYISVNKPTAAYSVTDSFFVCPPVLVLFTNKSSGGAISYQWFFGDGNVSSLTNPSDVYITPGLDTTMLIAIDANGCRDTAKKIIEIFGYAGAFTYTPLTGCTPLTVHFKSHLTNVPNIIFDYADGTTSPKSSVDSADHVYQYPGYYIPKLVLSDNTGCENSSNGVDTIKVDAMTMGFTTEPSPACEGVQLIIKDTSTSYFSKADHWRWTLSDGTISTLQNPLFRYDKAGTYKISLSVSDGWGCADSGTRDLVVYPLPVIKASPDTVICVSDTATLRGYGGVSYVWNDDTTLFCTKCNPALARPHNVTTYTVTGTDEHGCQNKATTHVFMKTKTVSTGHGDTTVCFGAVVQLWDSGATKFNWTPAKGLNDAYSGKPLAFPDTTTNYMVIAQLNSCIPDTNYVQVTVNPAPTVNAGPDQTILAGTSAEIRASGTNIAKISWRNDSTLSCDNCMNPTAIPVQTTAYVINVTSAFGCPSTDTVIINVYCDKGQIFLPNTFTPNGDGENDLFYPRGRGVSMVKSFRIYNRWGQLMFERSNIQLNDATNGWDGSYQNDYARPDVYVYVLEAVCDAGKPLFIKGDVTIIR